jgi:hypothetical protein
MNERWMMNWNYERTMNDRTNERSEFQQHNDREKIIWTNERTNDRMIGRTNDGKFGSITTGQRLSGRTMNRDYERTNKLRTGGRTIEERPNDPCASVCLCGTWSGVCVGGKRVAMKWLRVGWEEALAPLFIAMVGGLGGGMRGLVGGWED